jgi:tRNA uridine 5-carboxymethylaminomethyl modification enzyme
MNKIESSVFEIIVVGGGHAGCEAALAAARMGFQTLLVTIHLADVARMPCNPAVGGLAKGQLVREIDALGGEMGLCIDQAGIQFRMLNKAKGPAVWSPRAQADKAVYHRRMLSVVESQDHLSLVEGEVIDLLVEGGCVKGIELARGDRIMGKRVILALGTFPNGLIHIGEEIFPGGREGEPPSRRLSDAVARLGIGAGRSISRAAWSNRGMKPRFHSHTGRNAWMSNSSPASLPTRARRRMNLYGKTSTAPHSSPAR